MQDENTVGESPSSRLVSINTPAKIKAPAGAGRRGKITCVSQRPYSVRPMDGRHMKRKGGYTQPESAVPWWAAGPGFMLTFDYSTPWYASKFTIVVFVVLVLAILKAIFS